MAVLMVLGVTEVRNQLVHESQDMCDGDGFPLPVAGGGGIRSASAYKHLGIKVSAIGATTQEITARLSSVKVAYAALARPFLV